MTLYEHPLYVKINLKKCLKIKAQPISIGHSIITTHTRIRHINATLLIVSR